MPRMRVKKGMFSKFKKKAPTMGAAIGGLGYTAKKVATSIKMGTAKVFLGKTGIFDTVKKPALAGLQAASGALKTSAPAIAAGAAAGYVGAKIIGGIRRKRKMSKVRSFKNG